MSQVVLVHKFCDRFVRHKSKIGSDFGIFLVQAAAIISLVALGICAFALISSSQSVEGDDSIMNILTPEVINFFATKCNYWAPAYLANSRAVLLWQLQLHVKLV